MTHEVIIGTDETEDVQLCIAQTATILKDALPDVEVLGVDVYGGGESTIGIGFTIRTQELVYSEMHPDFETVEAVSVMNDSEKVTN